MTDAQLDNELIPLLRNQQTTDVLRIESDTVRHLVEHMATRGALGVLAPPLGPGVRRTENEDVLSECAQIREAHDARVDRAVRAVALLRPVPTKAEEEAEAAEAAEGMSESEGAGESNDSEEEEELEEVLGTAQTTALMIHRAEGALSLRCPRDNAKHYVLPRFASIRYRSGLRNSSSRQIVEIYQGGVFMCSEPEKRTSHIS
ncbi:hypothetical protein A0H81_01710 [Grifola frondosa]|uniref:Uncharacterized protein n=1 Tax=Grifola frondosa TaxID=5627 RepID=A0A1C7MP19_GRIFR|nr:hypothetical protein A0H81_01710 [Grifola frondosa]